MESLRLLCLNKESKYRDLNPYPRFLNGGSLILRGLTGTFPGGKQASLHWSPFLNFSMFHLRRVNGDLAVANQLINKRETGLTPWVWEWLLLLTKTGVRQVGEMKPKRKNQTKGPKFCRLRCR